MELNPKESSEDNPEIQDKNLVWLKEHGIDKEALEVLGTISKIPKDKWKEIGVSIIALTGFMREGGVEGIFGTSLETLKDSIKLQFEQILSPITNELMTAINDALAPIVPYIAEFVNNLMDNPVVKGAVDWFAMSLRGFLDIITLNFKDLQNIITEFQQKQEALPPEQRFTYKRDYLLATAWLERKGISYDQTTGIVVGPWGTYNPATDYMGDISSLYGNLTPEEIAEIQRLIEMGEYE